MPTPWKTYPWRRKVHQADPIRPRSRRRRRGIYLHTTLEHSIDDIRLLCRTHNVYAAHQAFGDVHMARFRKTSVA